MTDQPGRAIRTFVNIGRAKPYSLLSCNQEFARLPMIPNQASDVASAAASGGRLRMIALAIFRRCQANRPMELPREGTLIGVAALERHARNGDLRVSQALTGEIQTELQH